MDASSFAIFLEKAGCRAAFAAASENKGLYGRLPMNQFSGMQKDAGGWLIQQFIGVG